MIKRYHIVVFLAAFFLISGWYASQSYNAYQINIKKLDILRSQERYLKNRITTFEEKKEVLAQVADFTRRAEQLGVSPEKWDRFEVDLQHISMSFHELQTLLDQANSNPSYYFIPQQLWVRVGGMPSIFKTTPSNEMNFNGRVEDNTSSEPPASGKQSDSDIVVSLEGRFLVRHHRGDNG
ncbi:MAG: hypothetical protein CSA29_00650 [Desulfobacterales bacterium]|nr:MAG: hypothetical protein CSA29_00650 [Desulfobacterales bacterium]